MYISNSPASSHPPAPLPSPSTEVTLREVYNNVNASVLTIQPKMMKNFKTGRSLLGTSPEYPELVAFLQSKPFKRKFWKFQAENQME